MTLGVAVEQRLLSPSERVPLDIAAARLPAPLRPRARLGLLDISEYFSETSGGVRTYLMQKARYVERHAALRQVLLVPGEADAIVETAGVRCYRLRGPRVPFHPSYRFMLATRSTARIVAHERPDVIEVGSNYFAPWLVERARRDWDAPVAWFFHANLPRVVAPRGAAEAWPRRALAALLGRYERRIARSVDCTIVASEWVRRDLEALGIDRVAHVPLGVDLDLHHPRRRAWAAATRRRHGLPAGPLVLYLGRFSREKGIDRLLDAWPAVRRRTGASLALVGDVPGALPMPELSGLGVHLVPFVRDRHLVADLHAAADVMVSPGCCETFGLAALEALASGTPVVAADQGGVGELVRRSGAGRTFHAPDPVDLAAQLEALLDDGPATPGARGRAYAEAEHDWDVVFDRLFGVYDRLVAT